MICFTGTAAMDSSRFRPYGLKSFVRCCNRARLLAQPTDLKTFIEEYTRELQDFMRSHPETDPKIICFDFEEKWEMRFFTDLLEQRAAPQDRLEVRQVTPTATSKNMKAAQVRTRRVSTVRRPHRQSVESTSITELTKTQSSLVKRQPSSQEGSADEKASSMSSCHVKPTPPPEKLKPKPPSQRTTTKQVKARSSLVRVQPSSQEGSADEKREARLQLTSKKLQTPEEEVKHLPVYQQPTGVRTRRVSTVRVPPQRQSVDAKAPPSLSPSQQVSVTGTDSPTSTCQLRPTPPQRKATQKVTAQDLKQQPVKQPQRTRRESTVTETQATPPTSSAPAVTAASKEQQQPSSRRRRKQVRPPWVEPVATGYDKPRPSWSLWPKEKLKTVDRVQKSAECPLLVAHPVCLIRCRRVTTYTIQGSFSGRQHSERLPTLQNLCLQRIRQTY